MRKRDPREGDGYRSQTEEWSQNGNQEKSEKDRNEYTIGEGVVFESELYG